jgi:hypothetical protein
LAFFCIYADSCIFNRGPKLARLLLIANRCENRAVWLIKLNCVLKQVEEDLTVDLFLNKKGDRDTCLLLDLGPDVALFDRNIEWLENVFDCFNKLGAGALNILDLKAFFFDLHLRKLRLDVILEQFARTPNDLHRVLLLWGGGFIFK